MRLRNAFRIFTDNFSNTYKLLLYRLVTGVLFFGISYAILNIGLHTILTSAELREIFELISEFFKALTSGNIAYLETFRDTFFEAVKAFVSLLGENMGSIVGSIVGVCVLYLISKFLNGVASVSMGIIFNDKLTLYSRTSFSSAFFKNLGQATLSQVIYVPISFVYDAVAIGLCWFFFFFTPSLLPSWGFVTVVIGLSLSIAAFVCLEALKLTVFSEWIPTFVLGKSVKEAFGKCFKARKGFGGRYSNFLILLYLLLIVNVLCAVCTLGSFLLISIPASYLMIVCLQLVCYYEDRNMKYYVSFRKIAGGEDGKEWENN